MSFYGSIHSHFEDNYDAVTDLKTAVKNYMDAGAVKVAATGHGVFSQFEDLQDIVKSIKDKIKAEMKDKEERGVLISETERKEYDRKLSFEIIPGIEGYFGEHADHIILIAKDYAGYQSLSRIISQSAQDIDTKGRHIITMENLKENVEKGHIYCTSACAGGIFAQKLGGKEHTLMDKQERIQKRIKSTPDYTAPDGTKLAFTELKKEMAEYLYLKENNTKPLKPRAPKKPKGPTKADYSAAQRHFKNTKEPDLINAWNEKQKVYEQEYAQYERLMTVFDRQMAEYDIALAYYEENKKTITDIETRPDFKHKAAYYNTHEKRQGSIRDIKVQLKELRFSRAKDFEKAKEQYRDFESVFGKENFFFELQNHGLDMEKTIYNNIVDLALAVDNPHFIASNDIHIGMENKAENAAEFERELSKRSIAKFRRFNRYQPDEADDKEYCIKSDEELSHMLSKAITDHEKLKKEEIIASAIGNIERLLSSCHVEFEKQTHYPKFCENENEEFIRLVNKGIMEKFPDGFPSPEYEERMKREIEVITSMGYAGYHLIVQDYLRYAKLLGYVPEEYIEEAPTDSIESLEKFLDERGFERVGIGIGPGRGSAAGSLCCYLLNITDIDPIKNGLLFERFLNPERVSMPDIDSDFKTDIRRKVVEYCTNKYGSDCICNIMTKSFLHSKGAIRTAARYMGSKTAYDYAGGREDSELTALEKQEIKQITDRFLAYGNKLAKVYNNLENKKVFDEQLADKRNYTTEEIYGIIENMDGISKEELEILKYAKISEGMFSEYGQHAAGVIISGDKLNDIIPIFYNTSNENFQTQCQMSQAEDKGLLKMDFLGLKNLNIITNIIKNPTKKEDVDTKLQDYRVRDTIINDASIYRDIYAKGLTHGIFQFESKGMQEMLKKFQPECFDDIVILNAAYRPGPMQYIPEIIAQKWHEKDPEKYPEPKHSITLKNETLHQILKNTYGVPVYQEQIMRIFQDMAGYSLGAADNVRRFMSKKKMDKLAHEEEAFIFGDKKRGIDGCIKRHGISEQDARDLFHQMMPFAKYGFNKSHAVAYSQVSVFTAYCKKYHTADFYRYSMSAMGDLESILPYMEDMRTFGLETLPPDIMKSENDFTVEEENGKQYIRFGFQNIKGLGAQPEMVRTKNLQEFMQLNPQIPLKSVKVFCELGMFDSRWLSPKARQIETACCNGSRRAIREWYDAYGTDVNNVAKMKAENAELEEALKSPSLSAEDQNAYTARIQKNKESILKLNNSLMSKMAEDKASPFTVKKRHDGTTYRIYDTQKAAPYEITVSEKRQSMAFDMEYTGIVTGLENDLKELSYYSTESPENKKFSQTFDILAEEKGTKISIPALILSVSEQMQTQKGANYYQVRMMDMQKNIITRRFKEAPVQPYGVFSIPTEDNKFFYTDPDRSFKKNVNPYTPKTDAVLRHKDAPEKEMQPQGFDISRYMEEFNSIGEESDGFSQNEDAALDLD